MHGFVTKFTQVALNSLFELEKRRQAVLPPKGTSP
jgi:hypothetical protein